MGAGISSNSTTLNRRFNLLNIPIYKIKRRQGRELIKKPEIGVDVFYG